MANKGIRFINGQLLPEIPVKTKVRLTLRRDDDFKHIDVCEVHRHGLYVREGKPWRIGSKVEIELFLLDERVPFVGSGEVDRVDHFALYVEGVVPGMSIRFLHLKRKTGQIRTMIERGFYLQRKVARSIMDFTQYASFEMLGDRFERDFGTPGSGFRTPVLLIHGFMGTRGAMLPMERRLKHLGFPVFSIHLGALNLYDIRKSAKKIAEAVIHLTKQHKLPKIDVIGHSMGGLIGLYYLKHLEGHKFIRKLICIGTPFGGTWAAIAGVALFGAVSKSSWQLMKNSDFLRELHEGELPVGPRYYSLIAKNDELVHPAGCTLEGGRNYLISGGHTTLVLGEECFGYIMAILEDRDPLPSGGVKKPNKKAV